MGSLKHLGEMLDEITKLLAPVKVASPDTSGCDPVAQCPQKHRTQHILGALNRR